MSLQLSGELGEMGTNIAKFGKKIATDAFRTTKEHALKRMEGLVSPTEEQYEMISNHLGEDFLHFCDESGIEILVPEVLFFRWGPFLTTSYRNESSGAKSERDNEFRFGFFDTDRWVDVNCHSLELYKDEDGVEMMGEPKRSVNVNFMFTEDQLKLDIQKYSIGKLSNFGLDGMLKIDRAKMAMNAYLRNRKEVNVDIVPTLGFFRKCKNMISKIDSDCAVKLTASDHQRARLYRAGLKELTNVSVSVVEDA
ncbi:MAG: hypothetical protein WAV40_05095 [Microgenomates group bacterium]